MSTKRAPKRSPSASKGSSPTSTAKSYALKNGDVVNWPTASNKTHVEFTSTCVTAQIQKPSPNSSASCASSTKSSNSSHSKSTSHLSKSSKRPKSVKRCVQAAARDRKSTRLNSSHVAISYAVFCLKKKKYQVIYN